MPRKARRRSWGSVTEVTKGKKYVLRWVENTDTGRRRRSKTFYGTYREADRELSAIRCAAERPVTLTVSELWENYELPILTDGVADGTYSKSTLANYESKWRRYVEPRWGDTPCTNVRPIDVQEWLSSMSKSNGKLCRAVLKVTLEHAVLYELIPTNPAAKTFRYGRDTSKDLGVYTVEQLDALWDAVRGSVCEVPFLLCAHAGLRVGEACGMPLSAIEFTPAAAILTVSTQMTQRGETGAKLKTRRSERTVGLPAPWCERLSEIIDGYPEWAAFANDEGTGEPVPRWRVADTWTELVRGSGLPYLPMQALRPSFETYMHWTAQVPIDKMARIMGHTKPTTTIDHYDRPTGAELVGVAVDAANRIDAKTPPRETDRGGAY